MGEMGNCGSWIPACAGMTFGFFQGHRALFGEGSLPPIPPKKWPPIAGWPFKVIICLEKRRFFVGISASYPPDPNGRHGRSFRTRLILLLEKLHLVDDCRVLRSGDFLH